MSAARGLTPDHNPRRRKCPGCEHVGLPIHCERWCPHDKKTLQPFHCPKCNRHVWRQPAARKRRHLRLVRGAK